MASTLLVDTVTKIATSWGQDTDNAVYNYLTSVAGTNTITAIGPVGLAAYAAGLAFRFIPAVTNSGAVTINITGTGALGARSITKFGTNALVAGDLRTDTVALIIDDGTRFQLLNHDLISVIDSGTGTLVLKGAGSTALTITATALMTSRLFTASDTVQINNPGNLKFTATSSKIIPGATSISLRNNADSADNLLVTDAGTGAFRSSLVWGTGAANFGTITKRKTADETVTSSAVLQDDDHLTFSIAANEEWLGTIWLNVSEPVVGIKTALTFPAGATLSANGFLASVAATVIGRSTTSGGTIFSGAGASNDTALIYFWILNGATPGSITLQWAQSSSNGTGTTVSKGSWLQATRVA